MDKKKYEGLYLAVIWLSDDDIVTSSGLEDSGGDSEGEKDYFLPLWIS